MSRVRTSKFVGGTLALAAAWTLAAHVAITAQGLASPPVERFATWSVPAQFPLPTIPADNPMTPARVELGRHLFYDTRLSGNGTQSCATCHEQARAFTDARPRGLGSTGELHPRGPMSLVNIAYATALTWANPTLTRLEDQALAPMYGDHPIELGMSRTDEVFRRLEADARYRQLFADAYGSPAIDRDRVVKAIAAFERSIVSARSPYDRYHFDRDDSATTPAARRGEVLFHSRPLSCFQCHGGVNFSSAMSTSPGMSAMVPDARSGATEPTRPFARAEFHNTGLYNLAGAFSYPPPNTGIYEYTLDPKDVGKFKPPTLRNIAVTAPYMHDGSIATLEDVIEHYAAGGRTIRSGEHQGVGHDNPNRSPAVNGFTLTADQKADLIAFLRSLTDEEVLKDPRFANPWPRNPATVGKTRR